LTEDQEWQAIRSIAIELDRLAHEAPTPTLEDSCENIALIVRGLNELCRNSVEALAKLTAAMLEQRGCDVADANQGLH
jgi:hypothetical protein